MDAGGFEDDLFLPIEHPYGMLTVTDSPIRTKSRKSLSVRKALLIKD